MLRAMYNTWLELTGHPHPHTMTRASAVIGTVAMRSPRMVSHIVPRSHIPFWLLYMCIYIYTKEHALLSAHQAETCSQTRQERVAVREASTLRSPDFKDGIGIEVRNCALFNYSRSDVARVGQQ